MSDESDVSKSIETVLDDGYVVLGKEIQDDVIVPFQAEGAGARGRIVRLGSAVNEILSAHEYPDGVANFLGEAIALTSLIGSSLKFDGKLILQTKTDGPISMLVVDYTMPGSLRAYANFDKAKVAELDGQPFDIQSWMGKGFLALTVDQGPDMERYQGIVSLDSGSLGEAAEEYFQQSEQIPSLVRLHVAKHFSSETSGVSGGDGWQWRAGGLMVQYLTAEGGHSTEDFPGDGVREDEDDNWNRARVLGNSVEVHELLDPQLAPERLLFRLYHEEGVRVFDHIVLKADCTCTNARVEAMLANFSADERHEMIEPSGKITVTCEFCKRFYAFDEADFLK